MSLTRDAEDARPRSAPGAVSAARGVRHDIQTLRALAVSSVVLYHLWPTRLPGGYVGVDVFFVVSGFLIGTHLLDEVERTGTLRLLRFWARRMKRLVPASALVLLATTLGVVTLASPERWAQDLSEVAASALQLENWQLAHDAVDYLAASNTESPTRHFWSLSVEEQFYVGLPLLLLLTGWVGARLGLARLGPARRRPVLVMLVLVGTASLAYCVLLTASTPSVAYFSTLTRAWEFVAGALLAAVGVASGRHRLLPWLGVGVILVGCVGFGPATSFPGYAAALPVSGTVLVLWSGAGSALARLGRVAPVALLGRVSYSAYLWHWPLLTLLPQATGRVLTGADKLLVIGLTIALAWASTRFVEEPIRFSSRLLGSRRTSTVVAWCATTTTLVVALAVVLSQQQAARDDVSLQQARSAATQPARCLGAQAMDPAVAPCVNPALDGVLVPDPAAGQKDDPNEDACWNSDADGRPRVCTLGPATGFRKHLLAVGDSHNNALLGVYRSLAERLHWRIDVAGRGGCYLTTAPQRQSSTQLATECTQWKAGVLSMARTADLDAVVVTHSRLEHPAVDATGAVTPTAIVDGLVGAWRELPDVPIIAIQDNPMMTTGTTACVVREGAAAARACALPRAQALGGLDGQKEASARVPRARVVDLTDFYCTATLCPPVIGHVLVYRDESHLTATYASTLVPYLQRGVVAAVGS